MNRLDDGKKKEESVIIIDSQVLTFFDYPFITVDTMMELKSLTMTRAVHTNTHMSCTILGPNHGYG